MFHYSELLILQISGVGECVVCRLRIITTTNPIATAVKASSTQQ